MWDIANLNRWPGQQIRSTGEQRKQKAGSTGWETFGLELNYMCQGSIIDRAMMGYVMVPFCPAGCRANHFLLLASPCLQSKQWLMAKCKGPVEVQLFGGIRFLRSSQELQTY